MTIHSKDKTQLDSKDKTQLERAIDDLALKAEVVSHAAKTLYDCLGPFIDKDAVGSEHPSAPAPSSCLVETQLALCIFTIESTTSDLYRLFSNLCGSQLISPCEDDKEAEEPFSNSPLRIKHHLVSTERCVHNIEHIAEALASVLFIAMDASSYSAAVEEIPKHRSPTNLADYTNDLNSRMCVVAAKLNAVTESL